MTRRRAWSIGLVALVAVLVVPASAQAQIGLPGLPNPLDLGVPNPVELIGNVFEYVLKTFFGLETKVTQRTVSWLLAAPVYTDQDAYRELNELRGSIEVAAWALFTLVFCVSAVRYYASGFTSAGSYEAVEALARGGLAAGTMVLYPQAFGALAVATNWLTYGITHAPNVQAGLTTVLAGATVANFTPLGVGTIAAVVAVVIFLLLIVTKVVIAALLALLYLAAPLAIALWPLPETSWLARTVLQSLIGLLLWPVVWALCFALFAVLGASTFTGGGSVATQLVKPWVSVAALYVSFKAPQLLARQAMLAGLTPSIGGAAARGLFYGRAVTRVGSAGAGGGAAQRAATAAA